MTHYQLQLAEESRIWHVQRDVDAFRTRTMDKYLDICKFPRNNPDYMKVLETAYYVLKKSDEDSDLRRKLKTKIAEFESMLYR